MSYCVNCGVELDESAKSCALCSTAVINPNKTESVAQPPFSQKAQEIPKSAKKKFFASLSTTVLFIPSLVCFLLNLFIFKSGLWSLYVVGTSVLLWVVFVFPFFLKKPRPYIMWALDTVAVGLHVFTVFAALELPMEIYCRFVLPLVGFTSLAVLALIVWLRRKERHWVLVVLASTVLLAALLLFALVLSELVLKLGFGVEIGIIIFSSLMSVVVFLFYCYSSTKIRRWLSERLFV